MKTPDKPLWAFWELHTPYKANHMNIHVYWRSLLPTGKVVARQGQHILSFVIHIELTTASRGLYLWFASEKGRDRNWWSHAVTQQMWVSASLPKLSKLKWVHRVTKSLHFRDPKALQLHGFQRFCISHKHIRVESNKTITFLCPLNRKALLFNPQGCYEGGGLQASDDLCEVLAQYVGSSPHAKKQVK